MDFQINYLLHHIIYQDKNRWGDLIYNNKTVIVVSDFLQKYMSDNAIKNLSADECSDLLAKAGLLKNDVGPKPGFNFRQLLREGRDGKIELVKGAYQKYPRTRWIIYRL